MGNTFEKLKCGRRDHSFFVYIFSCRSTCGSQTSALVVALRNMEGWFVAGWTVLNMKGGNNMQWIFIRRNDAEAEVPIFWPPDVKNQIIGKDPWSWERLKAKGEGSDRGWDDWMTRPTQWTWVWANSRREWRVCKSGVLQSVGHEELDVT